jgi:hypothetical protein
MNDTRLCLLRQVVLEQDEAAILVFADFLEETGDDRHIVVRACHGNWKHVRFDQSVFNKIHMHRRYRGMRRSTFIKFAENFVNREKRVPEELKTLFEKVKKDTLFDFYKFILKMFPEFCCKDCGGRGEKRSAIGMTYVCLSCYGKLWAPEFAAVES